MTKIACLFTEVKISIFVFFKYPVFIARKHYQKLQKWSWLRTSIYWLPNKTCFEHILLFVWYWQHGLIRHCPSKMLPKALKYRTITQKLARNDTIFSSVFYCTTIKDDAYAKLEKKLTDMKKRLNGDGIHKYIFRPLRRSSVPMFWNKKYHTRLRN